MNDRKQHLEIRLRTIDNFLDVDQKQFAMSVIEDRAIPSVIDGFKPVQRKIIYVANKLWKSGGEKPMKVFQLGGQVSSLALYAHGDMSMNGAITAMGQGFKNNLPLLEGIGQYGSLRVPNAGAPRYIGTKLSPNFRMIYKDFELLEGKVEEGYEIEPSFFLPIIPMVIVNGSSGIAVGYASNILNRNPLDVTEACLALLAGKRVPELKPWLSEFSGTYTRDADNPNRWAVSGSYKVVNTTTVRVTELPPSMTFEKYEEYLDSLVEKKVIADYENNSSSGVDYLLKFTRTDLKSIIDGRKLEGILKVNASETENLTTLDEHGHLKIFDRVEDLVRYFVSYRLEWYERRKAYMLDKLRDEYVTLINRAKFVKAIIERKLKVGNVPKSEVTDWLSKNKYDTRSGNYDYLLNMGISSLTKEKHEALLAETKSVEAKLDEMMKANPKDMYVSDLKELKKCLVKR